MPPTGMKSEQGIFPRGNVKDARKIGTWLYCPSLKKGQYNQVPIFGQAPGKISLRTGFPLYLVSGKGNLHYLRLRVFMLTGEFSDCEKAAHTNFDCRR